MQIFNLLNKNKKNIDLELQKNNSLFNIEQLIAINFINTSNYETQITHHKNIENIILSCFNKIAIYFNNIKLKVFLLPLIHNEFYEKEMNGVLAHTDGGSNIYLYLNLKQSIEPDEVKRIIIHESQHILRNNLKETNRIKTLLDVLIDEGASEFFVEEILGGNYVGKWANNLNPKEISEYAFTFKEKLTSTDPMEIQEVMFGNTHNIPLWFGYSWGYSIIKSYIQRNSNNNYNIIDLINTNSSYIYSISDYGEGEYIEK